MEEQYLDGRNYQFNILTDAKCNCAVGHDRETELLLYCTLMST